MEGDLLCTVLAHSGGLAHADDHLFQFVPERTEEACVWTDELQTNVTNCRCQQRPQDWLSRNSMEGCPVCFMPFQLVMGNEGKED